ncbi:MAG: 3D domain-containing protein [Coprococcus sp.]
MKKFTDSSKMLSAKLKKYLKRAGIAAVVVAVGVATFVTISTDDGMVASDSKLVSVATVEENSVAENPVEYVNTKSEFEELQEAKAEEKLSKVERSEKRAAAVALAENTETATEAEVTTTEVAETTEATTEAEVTTTELVFVPTEAPTTEKTTEGLPNEDVTQASTTEEQTEATTSEKDTDGLPDEDVRYDSDQGTYLGTYLLTAYCPCEICCGQWSNTENPVTASGAPAVEGVTIAAPSEFAFGTELVINGHTYVVQDRGGAITGNHLDVYFSSHDRALNFAMGYYDVYMK